MKNLMSWMVAALVIFLFWSVSARIQKKERQLSFSDFKTQLERGNVSKVTLTVTGGGTAVAGELANGQVFRTFAPPQIENLVNEMLDKGVSINVRDANSSSWLGHLISWTPIVIMVAFLIFFMRQMQSAGVSSVAPQSVREARLAVKARFWNGLLAGGKDLSDDEMMVLLADGGIGDLDELEVRKALYEMLSDGAVVITDDKKYRLSTRA